MVNTVEITPDGGGTVVMTGPGPVFGIPGLYLDWTAEEICFQQGDDKTTVDSGPYTVAFKQDEVLVDPASLNLPANPIRVEKHYCFNDWNAYLVPDEVKHQPAEIFSQFLQFPFQQIEPGSRYTPKPSSPQVWTGPMSLAGLPPYEGGSGESSIIGLATEMSAGFMVSGDPANMWAWTRGSDANPVHVRDHITRAPINLFSRPFCSLNPNSSSPDKIGPIPPGNPDQPDTAHRPSTNYEAFLAGRKLRDLGRLQRATTWTFICSSLYSETAQKAVIGVGQTRETGWDLRAIVEACKATELAEALYGPLPPKFLPFSYWKKLLDQQITFIRQAYISDPNAKDFRTFPYVGVAKPWQQQFVQMGLLLLGLCYPGEYDDVIGWAFDSQYQRCIPSSGWPMAAIVYNHCFGPSMQPDGAEGFVGPTTPGGPCSPGTIHRNPGPPTGDGKLITISQDIFKGPQPWGQEWGLIVHRRQTGQDTNSGLSSAQIDSLIADPDGAGSYVTWDPTAAMYQREVLAMAEHCRINGRVSFPSAPQLPTVYQDSHSRILKMLAQNPEYDVQARNSVIPLKGATPVTAVSLAVGQKVPLNVTYIGGATPPGNQPANPPAYTQTDATIGTLTNQGMSGVTFNAQKAGKTIVTADAIGANGHVTHTIEVTVTSPLSPLFTDFTFLPGTVS